MKVALKLICLFVICFSATFAHFQFESYEQTVLYKSFISKNKVGAKKKFYFGDKKENSSELTYLGVIKSKGKVKYHICREYHEVQAAIVKHGNFRVAVLDSSKKLIRIYSFSSEEELPLKVSDNKVYFKTYSDNGKGKIYFFQINDELPESLGVSSSEKF